MANLTPKQAENLYTFKTERFKIRPDHATVEDVSVADASIIAPKVLKSSGCGWLFAAALLVAGVVAGLAVML